MTNNCSEFLKSILSKKWLSDLTCNPCPLTASLYLKVVLALHRKSYIKNLNMFDFAYILNFLKKLNTWSCQVSNTEILSLILK